MQINRNIENLSSFVAQDLFAYITLFDKLT